MVRNPQGGVAAGRLGQKGGGKSLGLGWLSYLSAVEPPHLFVPPKSPSSPLAWFHSNSCVPPDRALLGVDMQHIYSIYSWMGGQNSGSGINIGGRVLET